MLQIFVNSLRFNLLAESWFELAYIMYLFIVTSIRVSCRALLLILTVDVLLCF